MMTAMKHTNVTTMAAKLIFKKHSKKRCVMIKAVNENAIPTP
tara:strand:- start:757 stop:882 length:126 start_codon:yes stop_codon:yes gene_type:complete